MENPKFIADNAVDRAVITATPIVSGMSAAAMQNDIYANVCRSTGTAMTIDLVWPTSEMIGGLHEPWSNLSPSATHRIEGFADAAATVRVLDTGVQLACPWPARKFPGKRWTAANSANAYAFGGGSHGRAWFANTLVRRLRIQISDPANVQGAIEIARLAAGEVFSPAIGADWNPSLTPGGTGTPFRNGAGSRRTTRGTKFESLSFDLSCLEEADRDEFYGIQSGNGIEVPLVASLYPNDSVPARERDHQMWCAFVSTVAMRRPNFRYHSTTVGLESI